MAASNPGAHFVLIHGLSHGAWCWYKVIPLLQAAGHRVTVLDLAASGVNPKPIKTVNSFDEYIQPLVEFLGSIVDGEKVILVGHSFGGISLATAADRWPEKIAASVFLTAFLPDTTNPPSFVIEEFFKRFPKEDWLDTQFEVHGSETLSLFGPICLATKLYQLSPPEDIELAKTLMRQGTLFVNDLSKAKIYSEETYGSVKRVYIVCGEDKILSKELQQWMIGNYSVDEVVELPNSDHMPMFCKTRELSHELVKIADKYA